MDNTPNPDNPNQPQPPQSPIQQPEQPPQQPQFSSPQPPVQGQQPYQQPQQQSQQSDTLGIVSLIMAFFVPLIGFVLGLIGRSKAKKGGYSGTLSVVGIILNAVFMVVGTLILVFVILASFQGAQEVGRDTVAVSNVNSAYQKLEEYHNENGSYPEQLVLANFPGIDPLVISEINADSRYQYSPTGCATNECSGYTITYKFERESLAYGDVYEKRSLN